MIADGSLLAEPLPDRGVRGDLANPGTHPALGPAAAAVDRRQFHNVTIKLFLNTHTHNDDALHKTSISC